MFERYVASRLVQKANGKIDKPRRVEDVIHLQYAIPQKTDKQPIFEIVNVAITKDDLDEGEELPIGGSVPVIKIITECKLFVEKEEMEKKIYAMSSSSKLGTFLYYYILHLF